MVVSRHNSVETREPRVFVENGEPVRFYLLGTHEAQQLASSLTEGARTALRAKIEVCSPINLSHQVPQSADPHGFLRGMAEWCATASRTRIPSSSASAPWKTTGRGTNSSAGTRNHRRLSRRASATGGTRTNGCHSSLLAGAIRTGELLAWLWLLASLLTGGWAGAWVDVDANSGRTEFTSEDDEHICRFLATVIPDPLAGGRTGQKIWRKLVEDAQSVSALWPLLT